VPGLSRRLRRDRDRGGVAALLAVMLAGGTLLAFAAFAVDMGVMYGERAQLLGGANAAALTIAENCARPGQVCNGATGRAAARSNANANAMDNAMTIDSICGRDLGTGQLGTCSPPVATGAHCLGTPPAGVSYAEVYTSTLTPDGATVLPRSFAGSIAGFHGATIRACSRVAWGMPNGPYAALTVSQCQFTNLTSPAASNFPPAYPSIPANPAGIEVVIKMATPNPGCSSSNSLGLLNGDSGCQLSLNYGDDPNGHTDTDDHGRHRGTDASGACTDLLDSKMPPSANDPRPYLLIPIYSTLDPDGHSANAHFRDIVGIAAFQVTGYKLSDDDGTDAGGRDWLGVRVDENQYCGSGTTFRDRCIRGYFVSANIIDGTWPAAGWHGTYGVSVFRTSG
jgi:Flp pilus assembly protein TadG